MSDPDILKVNDELARRFAEIEARLAFCRSAVELFERLLNDLEETFGIPFVWFTLIRSPETGPLLDTLEGSALLRDRLNRLSPEVFREILPDPSRSLLVSGDLRPFFRMLPPTRKFLLRSLAVSPLMLHGHLIGSLNHGDASPTRYEPGLETTLLEHLARRVSDRLGECLPGFFA